MFAITPEDILEAREAVAMLENELPAELVNRRSISEWTGKLGKLGLKLANWTGQRITDFAKAGAIAAGTGFGAWVTGLGDQIIEVLQLIFKFVG